MPADLDHSKGPLIRVETSTCLLGKRVRYDGGHKLGRRFPLLPVEEEGRPHDGGQG